MANMGADISREELDKRYSTALKTINQQLTDQNEILRVLEKVRYWAAGGDRAAAEAVISGLRGVEEASWTDCTISAECHTDDRIYEITFDAVHWFRQATDKEILALYHCGWNRDYPADSVAQFSSDYYTKVADMFEYLDVRNKGQGGTGDTVGFECVVDDGPAMKWLKEKRNFLWQAIEREERIVQEGPWADDRVQFPRLLAGIKAAGLSPEQMKDLRVSMNLTDEEIHQLLDRSEERWAAIVEEST